MANYAAILKRLGLQKEATRGTVETTPTVFLSVLSESELGYGLQVLPDDALRGTKAKWPSIAGIKDGEGSIKFLVRAQNIGEFLQMLLGNPTSAQQAATTAYLHTFTPDNSTLTLPTYTFFMDRSLNVLKYNLGTVSQLKLSCAADNLIMADATVLFKTEATGSIGSPSYSESGALSFQHVNFKIAGSGNTEVKEWEIVIGNGAFKKRTMSASQDVADILALENTVSGTFTIYFADTTERDKFTALTTTSVEMIATGAVIEGAYSYTVEVLVDTVEYIAFPYQAEDGLLAAKVAWKGVYNNSNTRILRARITNTKTSY